MTLAAGTCGAASATDGARRAARLAAVSGRRAAAWVANPLRSGAMTGRDATGTVAGTRRGAMVVYVGVKNRTSPTVIGEKKGAPSKAPEKAG